MSPARPDFADDESIFSDAVPESAAAAETVVDLAALLHGPKSGIEGLLAAAVSPVAPAVSPGGLVGAIADWTQALGREHVLTSIDAIDGFSRCTLPRSTRPAAVLRPANSAEVQEVVRIANCYGVPIYPISRGRNWGYGDACAVTDGQTIVDLSRMNAIREVNSDLAYAVVEPGVTQGQLSNYLRERDLPLWLDVTGAGPEASIVGNVIERGFGHTPYGDRFGHSCGLEVVLPGGELVHTGFGAFENAQAARVFPWGVGPWLDGLFTQSNFGVVTALGISLMRAPEQCLAFAFPVADERRLGDVVEALRELRLDDVVRSSVHIANDLRVISGQWQYPWEAAGGVTPLPESVRGALRKEAGIGAWNVMGALYGPKPLVAAARKLVRRAFKPFGDMLFFDERRLQLAQAILKWLNRAGLARKLAAKIEAVRSPYDMLRGIPDASHLLGAAWRSRTRPGTASDSSTPSTISTPSTSLPADCGLIWVSTVLPATRAACDEAVPLISEIMTKHGFEPLLTVTSVNARALCCVASICFNRSSDSESRRAGTCYDELFASLAARGYLPYRAGLPTMAKLAALRPDTAAPLAQIKSALDPRGILSPGRYEF